MTLQLVVSSARRLAWRLCRKGHIGVDLELFCCWQSHQVDTEVVATMAGTDVKDKTLYQSLQNWDDFKYWLSENKLQALGSAWLGAVGVSFAAQMYQDTPITLKIFQTRIYAQAVTLGALCGAAYITLSEDKKKKEGSDDIFSR